MTHLVFAPEYELTALISALDALGMDDFKPNPEPDGEFSVVVRGGDIHTLLDELDNRGIQYRHVSN